MQGTGFRTLFWLAAVLGIIGIMSQPAAAGQPGAGPIPHIVRMHVIPASDRPEDQALKLRVRDAVLAYLAETPLSRPDLSFAAAVREVDGRLAEIERVARRTLEAAGAVQPVTVTFGVRRYGERALGGTVLPAGEYLSLEVVLGAGEGRNFWCILFPSTCFVPEEAERLSRERARTDVAEAAAPGADAGRQGTAQLRFRWRVWDLLFGRPAANGEVAVSLGHAGSATGAPPAP